MGTFVNDFVHGLKASSSGTLLPIQAVGLNYQKCTTAAGTAEKAVSALTGFKLLEGASVVVYFANTNTAANPTLKVGTTAAKPIYYRGSAISAGYLAAGRVYQFTYDGNYWQLIGDLNTDSSAYQNAVTTANTNFPIILGYDGRTTAVNGAVNKSSTLLFNPSTNLLSTPKISVSTTATFNGSTAIDNAIIGDLIVNGSTNFLNIPTAPTAADGTNNSQLATTEFVYNAFRVNDAMVFKGVVNSNSELPATHKQGWVYKVGTSGTYAGQTCEVGDTIYCVIDGTTATNAHWVVVQNNIDILPVARGGTGATTAAAARANLGTWSYVSDSYPTIMPADGGTNNWFKVGTANSSYGILPSQSGVAGNGHNYLGTSSWYWKYAYIDEIHGYLNGNISGNAQTATKLQTARSVTIGANTQTFDGSANLTYKMKDMQIAPEYHFGIQAGVGDTNYVLITFNKETNWMYSFILRIYQDYKATDYLISGYNYGPNYWYKPKCVVIASTETTATTVYFGYTGNYKLWVAVPSADYTGAAVTNLVNGYTQADFENAITITRVTKLPGTLQTSASIVRPWYRDETVLLATSASYATNANYATTTLKDSNGYKIVDRYIPFWTSGGLGVCNGNGSYTYCQIATINANEAYMNRPIVFEISGRGIKFSRVTIQFKNQNNQDPDLDFFVTNEYSGFYLKKTTTSKWILYARQSESYGTLILHRITGYGATKVATVDMTNITELPADCLTPTYTGNVAYALSALSATNASKATSATFATSALYATDANYARTATSASYATAAATLSSLTVSDSASVVNGWRNVWMSYADGVTGRPAITSSLAYNTLKGALRTPALQTTRAQMLLTGTAIAGTASSGTYTPVKWIFNNNIVPTDGDIFVVRIPTNGTTNGDYGIFMTLDNGSHYYPIARNGQGRLTTHYPVGSTLILAYESDGSVASMFALNGSTRKTTITGGCFRVINTYDDGNSGIYQNYQAKTYKAGGIAITAYDLVAEDADGLLVPAHKVAHKVGCGIYVSTSTLSANSTGSWVGLFDRHYSQLIRKDGSNLTTAAYQPLFLKGTISNGIFTPDTATPYVCGKANCNVVGAIYMLVGAATTSNSYIAYNNYHPYYYCDGTNLRLYSEIAQDSYKLIYDTQKTTSASLNDFCFANKLSVTTWNGFSAEDRTTSAYPGISNGVIINGGWINTVYGFQIAIDDDPTYFMALRQRNNTSNSTYSANGGWNSWKRIPMGDGTGASGTWGINITGTATAATYTNMLNAVHDNEVIIGNNSNTAGSVTNATVFINYRDVNGGAINNASTAITEYQFCNRKGATDGVTVKAATFKGNLTGTASSASYATTAGSANGVAWSNVTDKPSTFTPKAHTHSALYAGADNRAVATTPNTYNTTHGQIAFLGLKTQSTIGTLDSNDYAYLLGLRGWGDSSGGDSHELAFTNDGFYWRHGATTTWGAWNKIVTTQNGVLTHSGSANFSGATTADNLTVGDLIVNGSTHFSNIPTAPTAADGTNDTHLATTQFVYNAFRTNDAMVFKGVVNSNSELPVTHYQGWTYKIGSAGTFAGQTCEVGDTIYCITDGTTANNSHWVVVQNNIDILPVARGGTGATAAAAARANLGTWSLVNDSFPTIMPADGTTNNWVKIGTSNSSYGLLPSRSGSSGSGHNYIGTSSWYWYAGYIDNIYGSVIRLNQVAATDPSTSSNARIEFAYTSAGDQPVSIAYTANDSYRAPAGLKILGGTGATPAWLEVEGNIYTPLVVGTTTSANCLNESNLTTQEQIDGFLGASQFKAATFKTTEENNVGFASNDGMLLSLGWTNTSYGAQLAIDDNATGLIKFRAKSSHWGNWHTIAHSNNITASSPTLAWNTESTVATIAGVTVKVKMPANPNTDTLVKQTLKSDNVEYKILTTTSASPTSGAAAEAAYGADLTINPSAKTITAPTFKVTSNATITYNTSNGCLEITV